MESKDQKIFHDDLKCEFCDGAGEVSRDSDGAAVEYDCTYCGGDGIDKDQLRIVFLKTFGTQEPCAICGCSINSHRDNDMTCPQFFAGEFYGWLDTKFLVR